MSNRVATLPVSLLLLLISTVSFAQHPNIRISNLSSTDPEEVTIAINPTDPLNLAAGANITYYYYSTDGGYTWTEGQLTSSLGVWGDPCVGFDADGNLYYAHLSWPNQTPGDWLDRIVVQKSIDGGVTWSDGVGVGLNPPKDQDKEWLVADLTNSTYRNNLYMAWTQFDNYSSHDPADSTRIIFSRSIDHGATWSPPVTVSDIGGRCTDGDSTVEGAVPAVGPNGEVYLSWAGHENIYFDKSLDGGITFGSDVIVCAQPGGWDFDVPGIMRCNGFPVTLCDAGYTPYRGHIYIVFSDQRDGVDDTDVFIVKSTDGGATWSSPARVIEEIGAHHQFFCWGAIDPVTGYVYIVFYDRRRTTGDATEVFMALSDDGGANWDGMWVSDTPFTPADSVFFGDYTNIAARNGKVYPIWMRMDADLLSIWTAIVDIPTGADVAEFPAAAQLKQNYPNPFNPYTTIEFELGQCMNVSVSVYDTGGRLVAVIADGRFSAGPNRVTWNGINTRGERVSSGVYFCRLNAGGTSLTKKMTLLK